MLGIFNRNILATNFMKAFKAITKPKSDKQKGKQFYQRPKKGGTKKMQRMWEYMDSAKVEQHLQSGGKKYKLLSYNILAQDLLTEHLYLYIDIEPQMLRWEHRMRRLKEEIDYINPDILCLQEMQFNHLKGLVKKIRGDRQMDYLFKKKTGHRTDGCAIIYDKKKFMLLEERDIEYYTPGIIALNRENIALMAKFRLREEPDKDIVVATTHLLYNPKRQDVRMAQVEVLLCALQDFSTKKSNTYEANSCGTSSESDTEMRLPILLTGDFNFEPNSPPHALLTAPNDPQRNCTCKSENDCLEMSALRFGNTSASTLQHQWIIVDYILHSVNQNSKKVKVWSIYKLPTVQDCMQCGKIPNQYLGSDHFSLAIDFSVM